METASRDLLAKIGAARSFLELVPAAGVDAAEMQALASELAALEMRFALSTSYLHLQAAQGEAGRQAAQTEFTRILATEGFSVEVDRLFNRGVEALLATGVALRSTGAARGARRGRGAEPATTSRKRDAESSPSGRGRGSSLPKSRGPLSKPAAATCADLQRLINAYPCDDNAGSTENGTLRVDYERCPVCGSDMVADTNRSVLCCREKECGAITELVGTVFDDSQFYSQEGQKAKSGTFNPNRHFQHWWAHILAREPEDEIGDRDDPDNLYGEKLIESLRAIVARDHKILRLLTVNDARAMLCEVGRTDLNKDVPLLLKKLTGVGPPQIPESTAARVENLFTKAIEVGERVRRKGRVNRNYYPFYIFKILDQLLPEDEYENRRVLYYIYMQSKETVEADDDDWEQICSELPELVYKPTDRFLGLKYGPA